MAVLLGAFGSRPDALGLGLGLGLATAAIFAVVLAAHYVLRPVARRRAGRDARGGGRAA